MPPKKKGAKKAPVKPTPTTKSPTETDNPDVPVSRFDVELEKEKRACDAALNGGYDDQYWMCARPDLGTTEFGDFADLDGLADQVLAYKEAEKKRKEAEEKRKEAEEKRKEAEKKRKAAEKKKVPEETEEAEEAEETKETEDNENRPAWEMDSDTDGELQAPTNSIPQGLRIRVVRHGFRTLYERLDTEPPAIKTYHVDKSVLIPPVDQPPLDTKTLVFCSSETRQWFQENPKLAEIRLPAKYPRVYHWPSKGYYERPDGLLHLSYVHPDSIVKYIVPWLRKMEGKQDIFTKWIVPSKEALATLPKIEIPSNMEDRINLYNCMLHLGILKCFQQDLVTQLCDDIYNEKLRDCHLELLDITVGRFNSQTVAVCDPVLACFAGSFKERDEEERMFIKPTDRHPDGSVSPRTLSYGTQIISRAEGEIAKPIDTLPIAPGLPVLGHCLRHWSLVNEENPAAELEEGGYPLDYSEVPEPSVNVNRGKRSKRERSPDPFRFVKHLKNMAGRKRKACNCEECLHNGPNKVSKQ